MPKENCTNFDVVLHILYKKILFIYGLCFAKPKNMCKLIKINLPGRRKKCIEVQWKNIGKRKMVGYGIYDRYSCYIYSIDWWWCWAIRNLEKECERRSLLRSIENGFVAHTKPSNEAMKSYCCSPSRILSRNGWVMSVSLKVAGGFFALSISLPLHLLWGL